MKDSGARFRQSVSGSQISEFLRSRNVGLEHGFGDRGVLDVVRPSRQFRTEGQREAGARRGRIATDAGAGVAKYCISGRISRYGIRVARQNTDRAVVEEGP